tara:strand:- start:365 stop:970 length:606 start_codon:yes stop_codon:yes gene_type:complete
MIEKHRYWYFNTLSKKFINDLLLYGKQQELGDGVIGKNNEPLEKKELYKTRKSKVAFINEYWINKELTPFINDANINADWKFHLSETEPSQFTYYNSDNSFYGWHQDSFSEPYENHNVSSLNGKYRKMSSIISLSDKEEYEGGELEFCWIQEGNYVVHVCKELYKKGAMVVFPSYIFHRVKPITKGERYSLVTWIVGEKFK